MWEGLEKQGRNLEEAFFLQRDAELIAQHKKLEEMKKTRESLSEISGIRNVKVIDKLMELKVSPSILASLVVLPLVEVAWADGELHENERKAVLAEAAKDGLSKGSIDYSLLEAWLKHRPPAALLDSWAHYIEGLHEVMTRQELDSLKAELLDRARKVANAEGGFLGLSKISPEEKTVLKKMEDAFK